MHLKLLIIVLLLLLSDSAHAQQKKPDFSGLVQQCMAGIKEMHGKYTIQDVGLRIYIAKRSDDQVMVTRFAMACAAAYAKEGRAEKLANLKQ